MGEGVAVFPKIGEVIMMGDMVGRSVVVEGRDRMSKEQVQHCQQAWRGSEGRRTKNDEDVSALSYVL